MVLVVVELCDVVGSLVVVVVVVVVIVDPVEIWV